MGDLRFDSDTHTYYDGDCVVPGVTTVIERVCQYFASVPDAYLIPAQKRGTAVHLATELYDLGTLDEDQLDPVLEPYLEAWKRFLHDTSFEPDRIEQRIYNHKLRYAGTLDRAGMITWKKARRRAIVDIKTGAPVRSTALQTAAYQKGLEVDLNDAIKTRLSVHLQPNKTFKVIEYNNPSDMRVFTAMLTSYRWMENI